MAYLQGLCWFTREYPPSHSTPMLILASWTTSCMNFWWTAPSSGLPRPDGWGPVPAALDALSRLGCDHSASWHGWTSPLTSQVPSCKGLSQRCWNRPARPIFSLEKYGKKTHGLGAGSSCRLGQCCPHSNTMLSVHFRTFRLYNILCNM